MINQEFYKKQFQSFYEPFEFLQKSGFENMINQIDKFYQDYHIYPVKKKLFECFRQANYDALEVVFIGIEPIDHPSADGLFLTFEEMEMFYYDEICTFQRELEEEYGGFTFDTRGIRRFLIESNILLLNSSLMKRAGHNEFFNEFFRNFLIATVKVLVKKGCQFCIFGYQNHWLKEYIPTDQLFLYDDLKYHKIDNKGRWKFTRQVNFKFEELNSRIENRINWGKILYNGRK